MDINNSFINRLLPNANSVLKTAQASSALDGLNTASAPTSASVQDNYLDPNSLNSVKAMGRHNNPAALKEIAKKFESMFVSQMLKSMREANQVFSEGDMFSSDEVKFHQEMLDQQMVLNLTSGAGIGLAKSMYQQMQTMYGKHNTPDAEALPQPKTTPLNTDDNGVNTPRDAIKPLSAAGAARVSPGLASVVGLKRSVAHSPEDFIARVKPFAEKAAAELNINSDVLIAQAALETGWGKHLIHDRNGNNSFNIFNIKSSQSWQGKSVAVNSLENKQGVAYQERSEFRQYDNYVQSFADYVNLIKNNPRYQKALAAGNNSHAYATELQKAGYATDPHYAKKIKQILASDVIRSTASSSNQVAANISLNSGQNISPRAGGDKS